MTKKIITVVVMITFPIWIIPYGLYFIFRMFYDVVYDMLYGHYT